MASVTVFIRGMRDREVTLLAMSAAVKAASSAAPSAPSSRQGSITRTAGLMRLMCASSN